MKPFIASIVRNLLQVLAGVLLAYGVNESDASQWVQASEPIVTGLILYVIAQLWSFKRISAVKAIGERFGFKV